MALPNQKQLSKRSDSLKVIVLSAFIGAQDRYEQVISTGIPSIVLKSHERRCVCGSVAANMSPAIYWQLTGSQ